MKSGSSTTTLFVSKVVEIEQLGHFPATADMQHIQAGMKTDVSLGFVLSFGLWKDRIISSSIIDNEWMSIRTS